MEEENGTLFLRGNIGGMGTSRLASLSQSLKKQSVVSLWLTESATYMPAKTGSAFICVIEGRQ